MISKQLPKYLISKFFKKIRLAAIINSKIDKTSKVESGSHIVGSTFGRYTYCGYDCEIINCDIGNFVSIANNCKMGGATHVMSWVSTSPVFYYGRDSIPKKFSQFKRPSGKRIRIGHDVWIAEGCIIKEGVKIGTGAVIGMGSIETRDIPPYSIAVGNPAHVIKYRFDEETIRELLNSDWWNLSDAEIQNLAQYITHPDEFIQELGK